MQTGDNLTTTSDMEHSSEVEVAAHMMEETMRPVFLLNQHCKPVSAIVNRSQASALPRGTVVTVSRDIDLGYYGNIPAGSKGWVDWEDPETGRVEVFMEGQLPALVQWFNMLSLVPFQTEDLLDALVCVLRCTSSAFGSDNVTSIHRTAS